MPGILQQVQGVTFVLWCDVSACQAPKAADFR